MVEVLQGLIDELFNSVGFFGIILKILAILFVIYVVFLMVRSYITFRRHRRIDKIYEKVIEIDEKLDYLIKKKKIKNDLKNLDKEEINVKEKRK